MKKINHILLIAILLLTGFADRQPVSAITTSLSSVETADSCMANAAQMDSAIAKFTKSSAMAKANIGICIMDLRTGETLASYKPQTKLIPASIMKIVTSAAGLKYLSPNFKFRTFLEYSGDIDNDGTLRGDLIIEGGTDPTLGSQYFNERETFIDAAVETVKSWGIRAIEGTIRTKESIRIDQAIPSNWMNSDITEYYGAGIYSINYNDNLFSLIIDSSGSKVTVADTIPHLASLKIDNQMRRGTQRKGRYSPIVSRKRNSSTLTLSGTIRRMNDPIELVTTMPHPAEGLCFDLKQTLEAEGILVAGSSMHLDDNSETFRMLSYESPALPEIIHSLLCRSDNMYAEAVFRMLGQRLGGGTSTDNGSNAVQTILRQWNINPDGMDIYDGSGLGRANHITPQFLATVLRSAARDWNINDIFPSLLPKAGKEGTVKSLLADSPLAGNIALKSGSMNGVKCYAGYYPAVEPKYAVVLMVNGYRCNYDDLTQEIEQLFIGLFSSQHSEQNS